MARWRGAVALAYIESHQTLRDHPKLKRLARMLGLKRAHAVGHLHCLWWWALDYAQDGDVTHFADEDLADAAEWDGDPAAFCRALEGCGVGGGAGFLERTEDDRLLLHDWWDYAGRLIDQRQKNAERMRQKRAGAHADAVSNEDSARATHVQRTFPARAGATVPYQDTNQDTDRETEQEQRAPEAPRPAAPIAPSLPVGVPEPTPSETSVLSELAQIAGWPANERADLDMLRTLAEAHPAVDLLNVARNYRISTLDKPLAKNARPRSQFRAWVEHERPPGRASPNGRIEPRGFAGIREFLADVGAGGEGP